MMERMSGMAVAMTRSPNTSTQASKFWLPVAIIGPRPGLRAVRDSGQMRHG